MQKDLKLAFYAEIKIIRLNLYLSMLDTMNDKTDSAIRVDVKTEKKRN